MEKKLFEKPSMFFGVVFVLLLFSTNAFATAYYHNDRITDELVTDVIGLITSAETQDVYDDFKNSPQHQVPLGSTMVSVSFIAEGAGYKKNDFGWATFDDDYNVLQTGTIFKDYQAEYDLLRPNNQVVGGLQPGDSYDIAIPGGLSNTFGFWLNANDTNRTYYSFDQLNSDGHRHFGTGDMPDGGEGFFVGIEDLWRLGDNDFNDLIVSVTYKSGATMTPEPGQWALILMGLSLLGVHAFRSRKAVA